MELLAVIATDGAAVFRSNDGKWTGTDGDSDIILLPENKAGIIEYGYAVSADRGRFSPDLTGGVAIWLTENSTRYLAFKIARDGNSLVLIPADSRNQSRYRILPKSEAAPILSQLDATLAGQARRNAASKPAN